MLYIQGTVGLGQRPPPDARQGRLARRPPPDAREGGLARRPPPDAREEGLARKPPPDAREGGLARKPPPDARDLAGVGRVFAGEEIRPTLASPPLNPAVSDAHGTVEHRESTILEGFPERRAVSGPGEKYARRSQACGRREEICPGGNPPDARSRQKWSLT